MAIDHLGREHAISLATEYLEVFASLIRRDAPMTAEMRRHWATRLVDAVLVMIHERPDRPAPSSADDRSAPRVLRRVLGADRS